MTDIDGDSGGDDPIVAPRSAKAPRGPYAKTVARTAESVRIGPTMLFVMTATIGGAALYKNYLDPDVEESYECFHGILENCVGKGGPQIFGLVFGCYEMIYLPVDGVPPEFHILRKFIPLARRKNIVAYVVWRAFDTAIIRDDDDFILCPAGLTPPFPG